MGGGSAHRELVATPLRLRPARGRRHLGLPWSQARCNPFQTPFSGRCLRAPFSHSAPSLGEASFGFAAFKTPLGRRGGWEKLRAEPGVGPPLRRRASAGAELGCKAQAAGPGPLLGSSLPALGTQGGHGGGACRGDRPRAVVGVGLCSCFGVGGSVAVIVRGVLDSSSHPFSLVSGVASHWFSRQPSWGRIFAGSCLLLWNISIILATAWS